MQDMKGQVSESSHLVEEIHDRLQQQMKNIKDNLGL